MRRRDLTEWPEGNTSAGHGEARETSNCCRGGRQLEEMKRLKQMKEGQILKDVAYQVLVSTHV